MASTMNSVRTSVDDPLFLVSNQNKIKKTGETVHLEMLHMWI